MDGACSTPGRKREVIQLWWKIQVEERNLGDLNLSGVIILNWSLKK